MSTDVKKLGNDALVQIDTAKKYITKVSRIATSEQKRQAAEIAETARRKVEEAMKPSNMRTISLKEKGKFDTSYVVEDDKSEVIQSEVNKLLNFVDKYSTRVEVEVVPKVDIIEVPDPALAAANVALVARVGVLQVDVVTAQANETAARNALAALTLQYNQSQLELADAKRDLAAETVLLNAARADLAAAQGALAAAVAAHALALAAEQATTAAMTADRDVKEADRAAAVQDFINMTADRDGLARDLATMTADRDAKDAALNASQTALAAITQERDARLAERDAANRDLTNAQRDLAVANAALANAGGATAADLAAEKAKVADAEQKAQAADAVTQVANALLAAEQQKVATAEQAARDAEQKRQAAEAKIAAAEAKVKDAEANVTAAEAAAQAAQAALAAGSPDAAKVTEAEQKKRDAEAALAQASADLRAETEKNNKLLADYNTLDADHKKITAELTELKQQLLQLTQDKVVLTSENERLTKENKDQAEKIQELTQRITDIESEITELYDEIIKAVNPSGYQKVTGTDAIIKDIKNLTSKLPKPVDLQELETKLYNFMETNKSAVELILLSGSLDDVGTKLKKYTASMIDTYAKEVKIDGLYNGNPIDIPATDALMTQYNNDTLESKVKLQFLSALKDLLQIKERLDKFDLFDDIRKTTTEIINGDIKFTGIKTINLIKEIDEISKNFRDEIAKSQQAITNKLTDSYNGNLKIYNAINELKDQMKLLKPISNKIAESYEKALSIIKSENLKNTADDIKLPTNRLQNLNILEQRINNKANTPEESTVLKGEYVIEFGVLCNELNESIHKIREQEKADSVKRISDLTGEVAKLNEELKIKNALSENQVIDIKTKAQRIQQLEAENKKLTKERDDYKTANDVVEATKEKEISAKYQARFDELSKKTDEAEQARLLAVAETEATKKTAQLDADNVYAPMLKAAREEKEKLEGQITAQSAEINSIMAVAATEKENSVKYVELLPKMKELRSTITETEEKLTAANTMIAKLEADKKVSDDILLDQQDVIEKLQAELAKAASGVSDAVLAKAKLENDAEFQKMKRERDEMKGMIDLLDKGDVNAIEKLKQEVYELKQKIEDLKQEKELVDGQNKNIIEEKDKQIQELKTKLPDQQKQLESLEDLHRQTEQKSKDLLDAKDVELKDLKEKHDKQIKELKDRIQHLTDQIKELTKNLESMTKLSDARAALLKPLLDYYNKIQTALENPAPAAIRQKNLDAVYKNPIEKDQLLADIKQAKDSMETKVVGKGEYSGGNSRRYSRGYSGRYSGGSPTLDDIHSEDDSLKYTAVGAISTVGVIGWFGFGGLLIFLLIMLIVWFAYQIYSVQFAQPHKIGSSRLRYYPEY